MTISFTVDNLGKEVKRTSLKKKVIGFMGGRPAVKSKGMLDQRTHARSQKIFFLSLDGGKRTCIICPLLNTSQREG